MNRKLEDKLGKLIMLIVFGYLGYKQAISILATAVHGDGTLLMQLALVSQVFGTAFLALIIYFTATRLPPRNSVDGIEPRVTAIVGTFIMMSMIVLPPVEISFGMRLVSTLLIIVGTLLSVYGLRKLGRSFSIGPSARALVTEGPYRVVRHPLYGAETITILGVVLAHWSPAAILVGQMWLLLQIRRAQHEELVLRAAFPEYEDYAQRVPMLIPGLPQHILDHIIKGPRRSEGTV